MSKKLTFETVHPFQDLAVLVAYHEGLFTAEGIEVEFIGGGGREAVKTDKRVTDLQGPQEMSSLVGHGSRNETGKAMMYNACEWGNCRRVLDSEVGARQIGRRASIAYEAIIVPPWSRVYTPQQLANVTIGVPYYHGGHYITIQMLEGFLPRDLIKTCQAATGAGRRYHSMMNGEIDATPVVEPYITVAEKTGCRVIIQAPFHGSEMANEEVDTETYAAFKRAVKTAVGRINADKRRYAHYFIDHYKDDPAVAALTVDDFNLNRILVVEPAPIPREELQRTYDWMVSWGMVQGNTSAENLVNVEMQREAHSLISATDN